MFFLFRCFIVVILSIIVGNLLSRNFYDQLTKTGFFVNMFFLNSLKILKTRKVNTETSFRNLLTHKN